MKKIITLMLVTVLGLSGLVNVSAVDQKQQPAQVSQIVVSEPRVTDRVSRSLQRKSVQEVKRKQAAKAAQRRLQKARRIRVAKLAAQKREAARKAKLRHIRLEAERQAALEHKRAAEIRRIRVHQSHRVTKSKRVKSKRVVKHSARVSLSGVERCIGKHESGNDTHAQNPHSSASGYFQFTDGTWNNFKGYRRAKDAPLSVQREKFHRVWRNGRGSGNWVTAHKCI